MQRQLPRSRQIKILHLFITRHTKRNKRNKRNKRRRMTSSLGHSPISHANQILQSNIAGGANPPNAHFTNAYGSMVGGVTGCGGAGGSAAALAGNPGYNIVANQSGGKMHRRGGSKRSQRKKRRCRRKSNKRQRGGGWDLNTFFAAVQGGACRCKRSNKRQRGGGWHSELAPQGGACRCKRSNKRQRGGLGALAPTPFSGANPPYQQYMSNIPASNNFSAGSSTPLPLNLMGTATPVPITAFPNCPTK